jgi:hypothetical protein
MLPGTVRGDSHVQALWKVADKIGAEGGFAVHVDRSLADQPAFVSNDGQDSVGLLRDLATAFHASLIKSSSGYSILRSKTDQAGCKAAHLGIGENWLRNRFATWDDQAAGEARLGAPSSSWKMPFTKLR